MAKRTLGPTRSAIDATAILGAQIRIGRHYRNWTAAELASRVGVSTPTIAAIEKGSTSVAIGTYFSAAGLVGIDLFGADGEELARLRHRGEERIALIPARVRHQVRPIEGDADEFDF